MFFSFVIRYFIPNDDFLAELNCYVGFLHSLTAGLTGLTYLNSYCNKRLCLCSIIERH